MSEQLNQSIERLNGKIDNLGSKIDDLAIQVGSLTETVTRFERTINQLAEETRDQRQVTLQLVALAQQQQATVDRLLSKN